MKELSLNLSKDVSLDFIWCPPGNFLLGYPPESRFKYYSERPQMQITLTKGFWLTQTVVTNAHVRAIYTDKSLGTAVVSFDDLEPIGYFDWHRAKQFCKDIATVVEPQLKSLGINGNVDLPTDAQWEYACRAGTTSTWFFGEDEEQLKEYAVYGISRQKLPSFRVKQKKSNPWGFYDQYGLVSEWVADYYLRYEFWENFTDPHIHENSPELLKYKRNDKYISTRGGGFSSQAKSCHSAYRQPIQFYGDDTAIGFRVAITVFD